jgi:hypothetical protein
LPDDFYRVVVKELSRLGFSQKPGGKGSHEKWCGGAVVRMTLQSQFRTILKAATLPTEY